MDNKPLKILIMRLSALGDIVNLTVIFSKIRNKYPEAEIHFLVKAEFKAIVANNGYNIQIRTFDSGKGLKGWLSLCRELQKENFDFFLDMHNNIRSWILSQYMRKSKIAHYHKPQVKRYLLFYSLINLFIGHYNLIAAYLKVLKVLGIKDRDGLTEIRLDEEVKTRAKEILSGNDVAENFVVILPIAAWKNKRYSVDRYKLLSQKIMTETDMSVIWLGGPGDDYLDEITFETEKIKKLIGCTSLMESMAILQLAKVVVGNDTGLTYAAQALGTPALIIEGPTSRETGAGHCQYGSQVLEKSLWCRPCSQKGDRKCYRRIQYCLDFSVNEVYEKFNQVLSGAKV